MENLDRKEDYITISQKPGFEQYRGSNRKPEHILSKYPNGGYHLF